jgi:DNA-binding NarL/FixJ family response regulator
MALSSAQGAAAGELSPDLPLTNAVGEPVITVSIVEDDDWIREKLAAQINQASGFRCVSLHRNGEEALQALPAIAPNVVLMDINMPKMNGIECLHRLKALAPGLNILMLTVYEDSDRIFDSLKAGANGYLLKRTSSSELIQFIRQAHQGGSPMSNVIARKVVGFFKQSRHASGHLEQLSKREKEILDQLRSGAAYKHIADNLGLSIDTVRMHIRGIYRKLQVHSRGEAVAKYLQP